MKKLLLIFSLLIINSSYSQSLVAGWDFSTQTGGSGNFGASPLTVSSKDANVTVGSLTRGTGFGTLTGTGAGSAWGSTNFTNTGTKSGEISANKYFTFTITANTGYKVSLNNIAAYNIRRSASGPTTGIWQYQIGAGSFVDIGTEITWGSVTTASGNPQSSISLSGITDLQNIAAGTTITFRIVTWGATATTGTWYLKDLGNSTTGDLILNGTVDPTGGSSPTKLAITTINGGSSPSVGTPYSITVQSQDVSNNASNVTNATAFTLTRATGTGTLGGTITGTILAGTNSIVVSDVTYNTAETGVSITATRTSGDALTPGTSSTFTVLGAADKLTMVSVPSLGTISTNLSSFTVEARRTSDDSKDLNYTGSIIISKNTGPGNITGTLTASAIAGVATFNSVQFDAIGSYTINAAATSLTGATSGNIVINGSPVATVLLRPLYIDITSLTSQSAVLMQAQNYTSDAAKYRLFSTAQYYCWDPGTSSFITSSTYSVGPSIPGTPTTTSTWWIPFQAGSNLTTSASYRDRLDPYSANYQTVALPPATAITSPFTLSGTISSANGYVVTNKHVVLGYDAAENGNLICATSTDVVSPFGFSLVCQGGTPIKRVEFRKLDNTLILQNVNATGWSTTTNLGDSPLPVELNSFAFQINGRVVKLDWETKTEKNSSEFIVERKSVSDVNDNSSLSWNAIGSVRAANLSNSPKQYSFTDKDLKPGKYQYRLKMQDNDGSFEYSKVIEAEIAVPKNFELSQNYPNPFNPATQIEYQLPVDAAVTLSVYNLTGEKVADLVSENQAAGYYSVSFNSTATGKNLSSGIYFYRINAVNKIDGNSFTSVKKMIMLK